METPWLETDVNCHGVSFKLLLSEKEATLLVEIMWTRFCLFCYCAELLEPN